MKPIKNNRINLNNLNKNLEFLSFRERSTILYFFVTIGIAIVMVMGFSFLDNILNLKNLSELFIIRCITSFILVILSISLFISKPIRIRSKVHIYIGFYIMAIYSAILSHYAGGISSTYWAGLNFILIFWLTLIPFTYKEIIFNSIIGAPAKNYSSNANLRQQKIIFVYKKIFLIN